MVSSFPLKKNTGTTIVFPILDADGDLVTGAAGLDSEVSIDGGTFADCTNESLEIATSSGMYKLTLTTAETNGDVIAVIVKTTTTGAKTTPLVFYTATQTLDETDAICDAIKAKTDNLPADPADDSDIDAQLATITGYLDTEIAAILADTNELQIDWVNGGRLDLLIDAIKAKTDALPDSVWAVAARALTDKAGFSLAADQSAVTIGTVTNLTTWDKSGYALSAAGIDAIIDDVLEGTLTLRQAIRIFLSALAGKSAGGGTNTITFRDNADTKARISATVDAGGNRTAVTLDGA